MESIEKLKILTGEKDGTLLQLLLEDAEQAVLSYCNRSRMIPQLQKPVVDLAVVAYNRMGTEGESSRSAAGESYSFDGAPKHIYDVLDRYRLARVGGHAYETAQETPGNIQPQAGDPQKG